MSLYVHFAWHTGTQNIFVGAIKTNHSTLARVMRIDTSPYRNISTTCTWILTGNPLLASLNAFDQPAQNILVEMLSTSTELAQRPPHQMRPSARHPLPYVLSLMKSSVNALWIWNSQGRWEVKRLTNTYLAMTYMYLSISAIPKSSLTVDIYCVNHANFQLSGYG